jgi:hypothetical protein
VALGSEVYDQLRLVPREQPSDLRCIGDINLLELVVGCARYVRQAEQIGRVRELVHVHEVVLGVTGYKQLEEVRTDKSGSSRDENLHVRTLHVAGK